MLIYEYINIQGFNSPHINSKIHTPTILICPYIHLSLSGFSCEVC